MSDSYEPSDGPNEGGNGPGGRGASKGERHANRAREMLRQGRLVDAERELRAAVASDPSRGDWLLNLGWTLEATGKLDEALAHYTQASNMLPGARDPRLAAGLVLAKLNRHAEAVGALEATLRIDPKCETAASMLIRVLAMSGRHEDAETAYYMAVHAIERPATSHLEIARSLLARGDLRRAEQCFRRAIAEGPTLIGARVELARALLLAGRGAETAPLLAEEFRRGPVPAPIALEAARIHLACGRPAEAGQVLEQLARVEPSNPKLHLLLARTMRRRDDLVRAARHVEIATRIAADLPLLGLETGLLEAARGRHAQARTLIEAELDKHAADPVNRPGPTDRLDAIECIDALLACGAGKRAATLFETRFGRNPRKAFANDRDLLRLAARLAFERGDLREGRACARRLLRLDPNNAVAIHNIALAALVRRDFRSARAWIRRGLAAAPGDAGLRKLRTLWWWRRLTSW